MEDKNFNGGVNASTAALTPVRYVDYVWDDAKRYVGPDLVPNFQTVFKILTAEGSFNQKGVTPRQASNGHYARLGVAMNEADRKNSNPANDRNYEPYDSLVHGVDVINGGSRDRRALSNWFDEEKGSPRAEHITNMEVARAMANTIMLSAKFVKGTLPYPDGLPRRAVSFGDRQPNKQALMSDRVEIPRGMLPGTVSMDLPHTLVFGESLTDHRRERLLNQEAEDVAKIKAEALQTGHAIEFPEKGVTVGDMLKKHKITLPELKRLNPGFDDRRVKPKQFIWIKDREVRQDSKGGDAGEGSETPVPESETPVQQGGPRIVINPSVFRDDKDALCVAFNEAFRIVMEFMEFNPVSEPTEEQRRFFADTAYSQDENQMRRTILARIATFDTSVKDPTDAQIEETVEFLQSVLEAEIPQTEFEQNAVLRILDTLRQVRSRGVHVNDSSSEASESMPPPSLT